MKSVVNRVAIQLAKALQTKGMALLVNHGISEEKVFTAQISLFAQILSRNLISVENCILALG